MSKAQGAFFFLTLILANQNNNTSAQDPPIAGTTSLVKQFAELVDIPGQSTYDPPQGLRDLDPLSKAH